MKKKIYEEIKSLPKNETIIGDFKNSNINWDIVTHDHEGNREVSWMEDYLLSGGNNILNVVQIQDRNHINFFEVGETLGNSDDKIIRFRENSHFDVTENDLVIANFR